MEAPVSDGTGLDPVVAVVLQWLDPARLEGKAAYLPGVDRGIESQGPLESEAALGFDLLDGHNQAHRRTQV